MGNVWSFDLGKGSIGEAVRDVKTNKFLHVESLLIPAEFASTKEATKRRRFIRTRPVQPSAADDRGCWA